MSTSTLPIVRTHVVMGSVASVHVHDDVDPATIETVVAAVFDELDRLESIFSTFRADSEISRINSGRLHHLDASREVIDVMDACVFMESITSGAFSCRRADGSLDPAGFVKKLNDMLLGMSLK